ncbi:unnamed protein product, partial [Staurois parvus]
WGPWAIGDHGAPVSLPTFKAHPKKPIKRYQGYLMGPPTDPRHSGSARVSKWSVHPWNLPPGQRQGVGRRVSCPGCCRDLY